LAKYTDLELLAEFTQKVNFLITQKGYSQAAIAEKVGENRGNFNRYVKNEAAKPTRKTLLKYLTKLNTVFYEDLKKMEQGNTPTTYRMNAIPAEQVVDYEEAYNLLQKEVRETFLSIQKAIESLVARQDAMEKTILRSLSRLEKNKDK
jgi:transcriptional regulator with XRE-family HTH domain